MSEVLRVAQVLGRIDSGGIETIMLNYWRLMDHDRVQFDFFFDETSLLPRREEMQKYGAGLHPLPPYNRPLAYRRALTRALRQGGYTIVHVHLSAMSLFALAAAKRAGVPVRICHNHSTAHAGEGVKTLLKLMLRPFSSVFATDLFACGEVAAQWMYGSARVTRGEVHILPNAIETGRYAFDSAARRVLREQLSIPQEAFVIGHVGRFVVQKNHKKLLEIFASVLACREDARLLLVGEGKTQNAVLKQAQRMHIAQRVIFTGAREDVDKLYSAMDVFCLPSFYEGMPVVAWEAQANGLPCVFSDEITREAQLGNAVFVALNASAEQWAQHVLCGRRNSGAQAPDIRKEAAKLQAFYLKRAAEEAR